MAKLTPKSRRALPKRDFAGPDRSYPIPDRSQEAKIDARANRKLGKK